MNLYEEIYARVAEIPYGCIASYGQVARATGKPRGAQVVGWALRALPPGTNIPWQRVINQHRQISIINPQVPKSLQKQILEDEGREVIEKDGYYTVTGTDWFSFESELPGPADDDQLKLL